MPTDWTRANKYGIIPKNRQKKYILRRYRIEVYQNGQLIDTVKRVINAQGQGRYWLPNSRDEKGNRPFIVQYKGIRNFYCVKSKAGDLSDPNERDDSYLKSLYIELPDPAKCSGCGGTFKPEELTGGQYLRCQKCNKRR